MYVCRYASISPFDALFFIFSPDPCVVLNLQLQKNSTVLYFQKCVEKQRGCKLLVQKELEGLRVTAPCWYLAVVCVCLRPLHPDTTVGYVCCVRAPFNCIRNRSVTVV